MRYRNTCLPAPRRAAQRGFSLVELSVAMLVALFLLVGFGTVLQGTRKTSLNQASLAQLQDDERIAMTMLTSVVESAGYYPNPELNDISLQLPATGFFDTAGQIVFGMANTGIPDTTPALGDVLIVRYNADANEDISNCQGTNNSTNGSAVAFTNEYAVLQPDPNAPPYLACSADGGNTFVPLVKNVASLKISYGINSTATLANTIGVPVDNYVPTEGMPTALAANPLQWTNVYSVKVQVTFVNPLYQPFKNQPPTPGQKSTVTFTRVIGVMSRVGVDVSTFT
ncbi:MAG: type pilus assembly protein PilW [Gammaproteobacteria bacterium]|jgi:type IV pilus assembly protein PilW|nr:type pilus assembly protein PilW [Gammaproteobacteria bacterium]